MTCATAGLISYSSISYLLAKLSELSIHRFCSHVCGQRDICVLRYFFVIKRITKRKIMVEMIELELIKSDVAIRYLGALIFFVNLKKIMVCPMYTIVILFLSIKSALLLDKFL